MSNPTPREASFRKANPHALATILEAAETRRIISATDIFDANGIKLWASQQPVSAELQRRLADRELREPLESSLVAEDGVSAATLAQSLQAMVEGPSGLARLLRPHAARLLKELPQLPLYPVAQLLLTAGQAARPARFEHAVAAMALNGALMAASGGDTPEIRIAMLCGLLHDLGELYIAPTFGEAEADRELDFTSFQQLVVHPHVGFLLLRQLTHYPSSVAVAVGEHHERLDGSGYPRALREAQLSPQGRLLSVTEAALAALGDPAAHLLHASVALRAVPGEFDPGWTGTISRAASAQPPAEAVMETADIQARLGALDAVLQRAEVQVAAATQTMTEPAVQDALSLAGFLLQRLRTGWNESGLWNPQALASADAAEVEALEDELYRRLRAVQRATLMRAGTLPDADAARLRLLCDELAVAAA